MKHREVEKKQKQHAKGQAEMGRTTLMVGKSITLDQKVISRTNLMRILTTTMNQRGGETIVLKQTINLNSQ